MGLGELLAFWFCAMPARILPEYLDYLKHTLADRGNMLEIMPYQPERVTDREIGNPSRVLVMSDQELIHKTTHRVLDPLNYDLLAKIDLYWGDNTGSWVRDAVESGIKKGYKHAYFLNCMVGDVGYRDCIYMDLLGYDFNDWVTVDKRLSDWDTGRQGLVTWWLWRQKGVGTIRLYNLLRQVAGVLTTNTHRQDELYDYFKQTYDFNGGFLRTRHCRREKPVTDRDIPDLGTVLLVLPVEFSDASFESDQLYEGFDFDHNRPALLKSALYFDSYNAIATDLNHARQNGFVFGYVLDLVDGVVNEVRG